MVVLAHPPAEENMLGFIAGEAPTIDLVVLASGVTSPSRCVCISGAKVAACVVLVLGSSPLVLVTEVTVEVLAVVFALEAAAEVLECIQVATVVESESTDIVVWGTVADFEGVIANTGLATSDCLCSCF